MLAVPQNMGFLACALPIESYSLCRHPDYADEHRRDHVDQYHEGS